jgi:hypothetical protein
VVATPDLRQDGFKTRNHEGLGQARSVPSGPTADLLTGLDGTRRLGLVVGFLEVRSRR